MTTTYRPSDARPGVVPFPAVKYHTAASFAGAYLDELAEAAASIDPASLDRATGILLEAYTRGNHVFSWATVVPPQLPTTCNATT